MTLIAATNSLDRPVRTAPTLGMLAVTTLHNLHTIATYGHRMLCIRCKNCERRVNLDLGEMVYTGNMKPLYQLNLTCSALRGGCGSKDVELYIPTDLKDAMEFLRGG